VYIMNKRPLSPHLQVYRLPLSAVISITHRIMSVGMYMLVFFFIAYLYAMREVSCFDCINGIINSWFGQLKIYGIILCGSFFLASEFRYILWSYGKCFDKEVVEFSNYMILVAAGILAALLFWGV